ncbi:uncharacterized protein LOC141889079 isoform X2 [Acropora palmata]|uniref:uncharacterized protein LOC141889079 isoform X2 n=1 Tax=Acropora palmata TaxID=6131 RepID=UPI003D9FEEE9
MDRKRKRIKAQLNVKYHKDDVVSRTKIQLSCDAEGETSGTWGGSSANETEPATSDHGNDDFFCSDVQIGSEGEEEEDTLHYQRLRKAEEAWSKVREGALLTTLQSEASLMETQCLFCASEATSRCLDCGPSMSLCESCAVEKHRTVHISHNVEILKNGIYLPLEIPRTLVWHRCSNGVHFRKVIVVNEKGILNEVQVQFCACEADFLRLLRFNLWAATPSKPELAFSFSLMELLHVLNLECQVAVKDFCAALQCLGDDRWQIMNQRKLYPVIIDSFEEFRHNLRNLKFGSTHFNADDCYNDAICPACPKVHTVHVVR